MTMQAKTPAHRQHSQRYQSSIPAKAATISIALCPSEPASPERALLAHFRVTLAVPGRQQRTSLDRGNINRIGIIGQSFNEGHDLSP